MKPDAVPLSVAVCIATHNRLADLQHTFGVLEELDPQPQEVLITADGCSDGTVEFVRANFPQHTLFINQPSRGSTASRDAMFRSARSDLVLILDDDSHPIETDFLAKLPGFFEDHPRLGVVTFPQRTDEFPETLHAVDFGPAKWLGTYVNCATAIRRATFLEVGGYPAEFRIAYDEPDFALRCLAHGWQIRFEPSLTIRHHYSGVMRNELRMHHAHARNELWSVLMRCPAPQLFAVALFRLARQFAYAWSRGVRWCLREPQWWLQCAAGLPRALWQRKPIPWRIYREWMKLVRQPSTDEGGWSARFGAEML